MCRRVQLSPNSIPPFLDSFRTLHPIYLINYTNLPSLSTSRTNHTHSAEMHNHHASFSLHIEPETQMSTVESRHSTGHLAYVGQGQGHGQPAESAT